jgi:hypothetical protein
MKDMILTLRPSPAQQAALDKLSDDLHNPASASYHHWLTPAQFGAQYGVADEDVNTVSQWLAANGFKIESVAAGKTWIRFSGNAQQVEQAFGTQIHKYSVNGATHYANSTNLSLPSALAAAVGGVVSVNNFLKPAQHAAPATVTRDKNGKLVRANAPVAPSTVPGIDPLLAAGPDYTYTGSQEENFLAPGDFAKLYDTNPLISAGTNGKGISIAIVGRSDISLSDVEAFRKLFQLPFNDPAITYATTDPGVVPGDDEEAILDVEWSGAVAPMANINLVIGASTLTTDGIDLSASYIVDHALAPIMSVSFGECEADLGVTELAFYHDLWQQASVEGITVLVAAGDGGSSSCIIPSEYRASQFGLGVSGLASTPYNVAVGGTELDDADTNTYWNIENGANSSSIKGYTPEAVWNESCNLAVPVSATNCYYSTASEGTYAGGGGASSCVLQGLDQYGDVTCGGGYPKPSWQSGKGVPKDGVRDLPDVALAAAGAHDGYLICYDGSCQWTTNANGSLHLTQASVIGGTSASSPSFAGLLALVEQKRGAYQGQANYQLYKLASAQSSTACNSSAETDPGKATSCVFHDVTTGSNALSCLIGSKDCTVAIDGTTQWKELSGYSATSGYDLASGLGSVDASNLVNAWNVGKLLPSATTLALSKTTFPHGTPVTVKTLVAALSGGGIPSGSITLKSSTGDLLNPESLTAGAFTGTIDNLPGGTYQLTADYGGDATYAASLSKSVSVTIAPEASAGTGTTYAPSPFFILGQQPIIEIPDTQLANPFYIQFQIAGASGHGVPTGSILLTQGSQTIGTYPLDATGTIYVQCGPYTNCDYAPGTYTFNASYSGDSSFKASKSSVGFTINKGKLSYSAILNNQTPPAGGRVVATVAFNNDPAVLPTGKVTLTRDDTGAQLAVGTINAQGFASIDFSAPAGDYDVLASWPGDAHYSPGILEEYDELITTAAGSAATSTTIAASASSATVGALTQFTVRTVASATSKHLPTGTVSLFNSDGQLGASMTLIGGQATGFVQWGFSNSNQVYAVYSGDSNFASSSSAVIPVNVTSAPTSLALQAAGSILSVGAQDSFTATLGSAVFSSNVAAPTGAIQFYDSVNGGPKTAIGKPQAINAGNGGVVLATIASILPAGRNSITAVYSGDANWKATTSNAVAVEVGYSH